MKKHEGFDAKNEDLSAGPSLLMEISQRLVWEQMRIRRPEGPLDVPGERNERLPRKLPRKLPKMLAKPRRKREESVIESKRRNLKPEDAKRRKLEGLPVAKQGLKRKLHVGLLKPRRPSAQRDDDFEEKEPRRKLLRMESLLQRILGV